MNNKKFQNALYDLRACMYDVDEHINAEAEHKVSDEEINAFRQMVYEMQDFLVNGICVLDDDKQIDLGQLEFVCDAMSREYSETFDGDEW